MSPKLLAPLLSFVALGAFAQQPVRDLPRTGAIGAASLSGTVLSDEREPRPLRRVRVFLASVETDVERTTITEDSGAFAFTELPAGRYTVEGKKEGYVTVSYGARRPGSAGTPINLRDKQAVSNIELRLPRGAVITGTLFSADGQPLPGVSMRVLRYTYTTGERRLMPASVGAASHVTDDRGVYRIYGLAPGEYAVAAPAREIGFDDRKVVTPSDAEIRRGLEELKLASRAPAVEESAGEAAGGADASSVGFAPVFYPGTTVASQAAMVRVAQGEERREVDFQVQLVPVSTLRGTVLGGDRMLIDFSRVFLIAKDVPVLSATGQEVRTAPIARNGVFSFSNVVPGQYSVFAKVPQSPASSIAQAWASTEVVLDGQTEQDVTLPLQPAITVAGRVVFDGDRTADLARVRVMLVPLGAGAQVGLATIPAPVSAAGRFTISGVTAGVYYVRATAPGGWTQKSATVDGRDVLDTPLDLRSSVDTAVVTFGTTASNVSGTVRDGTGRALSGYSVVIYSAERAWWLPGARRIQSVVSANDGSFTFRNLPAGEYLLGALADVEAGEWFDKEFLVHLTPSSVKVTLAEGESKSLDIVAGRQEGSGV